MALDRKTSLGASLARRAGALLGTVTLLACGSCSPAAGGPALAGPAGADAGPFTGVATRPTGAAAGAPDAGVQPGDTARDPRPDEGAADTASEPFRSADRFTAVIRGGTVVDGAGQPGVRADVLLQGDRIAHVGRVDASVAVGRTIDASGMVVAPGFIDAHAHADALGDARSYLAMGVTTLCLGQDGRSPSERGMRAFAARLDRSRPTLNIAAFVGHATVRVQAGVGLAPSPSPAKLREMARLVGEEMDAGAFGLSTGLEYQPGRSAGTAELVEIARPVAARGGVVMSHLRSEDDDAIDAALDELFAQGEGAGARVHVAHLKIVHGHGAERAERLLARLDAARRRGISVTADMYPYEASYTGIEILFPDWARPPHAWSTVRARRHEELRAHVKRRVHLRNGPEATLFGSGSFAGKTLAQVARERGKPFEDVLIDDLGPGSGVSAAYFVMDAALQRRLLEDRSVMIGSDGGPDSQHPRGHGTFARVIRELVAGRTGLSIEEAVRKMSGLPAATLGLTDRGLIRGGFAADLVVFDPAKVIDRATFEKPRRRSEGFVTVFINGELVMDAGAFTRARPGRLLRHEPPKAAAGGVSP